jgi:hypothetical protein
MGNFLFTSNGFIEIIAIPKGHVEIDVNCTLQAESLPNFPCLEEEDSLVSQDTPHDQEISINILSDKFVLTFPSPIYPSERINIYFGEKKIWPYSLEFLVKIQKIWKFF